MYAEDVLDYGSEEKEEYSEEYDEIEYDEEVFLSDNSMYDSDSLVEIKNDSENEDTHERSESASDISPNVADSFSLKYQTPQELERCKTSGFSRLIFEYQEDFSDNGSEGYQTPRELDRCKTSGLSTPIFEYEEDFSDNGSEDHNQEDFIEDHNQEDFTDYGSEDYNSSVAFLD